MAPFVSADKIVVKADRLVCTLQLSPSCPRSSWPALMEALATKHPLLPQHACKNRAGQAFAAVMNRTSLVHVVEHVAIDWQVQENSCSDAVFVGNSQWIDKQAGTGRVELSFVDDVAALRALKNALKELNEALESCDKLRNSN